MSNFYSIWLLGLFFATWETAHFGWNMVAKTDAEIICDGIALAIFALAFVARAAHQSRQGE